MITCQPATDSQYQEFLGLMLDHMADYLKSLMMLMEITLEQFSEILGSVGQVYSIQMDDQVSGFYWIEERGRELHLHGLILKTEYQGRGIGTQTLKALEEKYKDSMDFIELGVHKTNQKAIELYKKLGYQMVTSLDDLGFLILQKDLIGNRQ